MLPENQLSSTPVPDAFLVPMRRSPDVDYEFGGIQLQDITQGLQYQLWESSYNGSSIRLHPKRTGSAQVVVTHQGILHHSFAFDQNMNPCVVYKTATKTFLYWYNPLIGDQETIELDPTIETPQVSVDDNRRFQLAN